MNITKLRWTARISGTLIFLLVFPFYIGYGNPLPDFNSPSMSFVENLWLTIFPIFLFSLLLGWWKEKLAGYLITVSILVGFLATLLIGEDASSVMLLPLIPGVIYLYISHTGKNLKIL
jgi:hypothetical protein